MKREALFRASFVSPVDLLSHCLGEPVEDHSPFVLLDFKMSPQKNFKKKMTVQPGFGKNCHFPW